MKTIFFCILTLIACQCFAQKDFGGYAQVSSETFYKQNLYVSVGVRYREVRLGLFHQSAVSSEGMHFTRKGVFADVGLFNVDKIAYFSLGGRLSTTNEQFVSFVPHGTMAFRFSRIRTEIPISWSGYKGFVVASIGLRFII